MHGGADIEGLRHRVGALGDLAHLHGKAAAGCGAEIRGEPGDVGGAQGRGHDRLGDIDGDFDFLDVLEFHHRLFGADALALFDKAPGDDSRVGCGEGGVGQLDAGFDHARFESGDFGLLGEDVFLASGQALIERGAGGLAIFQGDPERGVGTVEFETGNSL